MFTVTQGARERDVAKQQEGAEEALSDLGQRLRIPAMVIFSLSCFGILLFLWVSFGGSIPLQSRQYVLKVNFPEATTLAQQADVRLAGVTIGKVHKLELDKGAARTTATLFIDQKYAPLPRDTRAILRQKTLLGETFVELSPGRPSSGRLRDGSTLPNAQVEPTVELDEILRTFSPSVKAAFRNWVRSSALQIQGSGAQDLNDALGNLAGFASDGAGVLQVLDEQGQVVRQLVRNTGVVFGALNERRGQLRDLIVNSERTFSATSSQQRALADTFRVFPTFLDESRLTLARLERFAVNTRPLVNELKPVAVDLGPTVHDLGALAPDLRTLFVRLRPVIRVAPRDLPQAARFLRGARPVFAGLHVFLPELNPVLSYLNYASNQVAAFLANGGAAAGYQLPRTNADGNVPEYMLAQLGIIEGRSFQQQTRRPTWDRGQAYPQPNAYQRGNALGVWSEAFDCRPVGGVQRNPVDASQGGPNGEELPPCFIQGPQLYSGQYFPRLTKGSPLWERPTPYQSTAGHFPDNPNTHP